jgi:hypothetical protein
VTTQWLTALWVLQTLFILVGVIIFLITPTKGKRELWELGALLVVSFLTDATTMAVHFIFHINVNILPNLFEFVNLPLALILYGRKIHWEHSRTISNFMIVAFILFATINFFVQTPTGYNAYTTTLTSVAFIVVALAYFYVLLQQMPTEKISRLPMFWVNAAFLIYYSGNFVIHLAVDYLIKQNNNLVYPWTVHNFLGLIFYSLMWIGLWLNRAEHLKKNAGSS